MSKDATTAERSRPGVDAGGADSVDGQGGGAPEAAVSAQPAAASRRRAGPLRRFFLMPERAERARAEGFGPKSPGWGAYARAKAAEEAAAHLLRSRHALSFSDGSAHAFSLLHEALRWALSLRRGGPAQASPPRADEAWAAFSEAPEGAAMRDAMPAAEREALEAALGRGPDEAFGLIDAARRDELAAMRTLLMRLLEPFEWRRVSLGAVRLQQGLRVGVVAIVLLVAALQGWSWWVERRRGPNLALSQHTSVSSLWGDFASAAGAVDGVKDQLGFHTKEELEPWVQIDLGRPRSLHEVLVHNRGDCCQSRAIPLRVEASTDGVTYRQLGRRDSTFSEWSLRFSPTEARYVRLKAEQRTMLHLNEIGVY